MPTDWAAAITCLDKQIWVVIGLAIGRVMQVMKLAYGRRSSENHLEKCHAGDVIHVLRVKLTGCVVHRSTPGPEVFAAEDSRFRLASNEPLKRMRMNIHEAGEKGFSWRSTIRVDEVADFF